jgi:cytochrome c-type biogenesis protein CcmH
MVVFWLLAALMTAAALAIVLFPLLRGRRPRTPDPAQARLEALRLQRREIEADVANGTLSAQARDEALAELVQRADRELEGAAPAPADTSKPWVTAMVVAALMPVAAFGLYLVRGTPLAADPAVSANRGMPTDEKQVVAMVETLARKVRERPDDVQGWTLLARSMAALGRFSESVDAYEHLVKLVPDNPSLLADYADALAMAQGRTLAGKPYELARQALALDPTHPKALALAATAAMDAGDRKAARGYLEALLPQLPPDSEDLAQVRSMLAELGAPAAATPAAAPVAGAATAGVSGSVTVAPAIAARVRPEDTLFVYARAENGPRMPLAIVRGSARELPLKFALDDSQSMSPSMKLSTAQAVRIEARVSRSGMAAPQSGDVVGTSAVVRPGARDVQVVLDKVVP